MLSFFELVSGSEASSPFQCCIIYIKTDYKNKNANLLRQTVILSYRGMIEDTWWNCNRGMREAWECSSQIMHQGFKEVMLWTWASLHYSFQQNSWACWRKPCRAYPVRFSATVRRSAGRSSKRQVRTSWLKVGSLQQPFEAVVQGRQFK